MFMLQEYWHGCFMVGQYLRSVDKAIAIGESKESTVGVRPHRLLKTCCARDVFVHGHSFLSQSKLPHVMRSAH